MLTTAPCQAAGTSVLKSEYAPPKKSENHFSMLMCQPLTRSSEERLLREASINRSRAVMLRNDDIPSQSITEPKPMISNHLRSG